MTYILGNLRPCDVREIECQMPEGADLRGLAAITVTPGQAWVAYDHERFPVMAFGFHPITPAGNVLNAWAFGTNRVWYGMRAAARFVYSELIPEWLVDGVTRIEARSIAGNHSAHKWLWAMGADVEGPVRCFGRQREAFLMFVWSPSEDRRAITRRYCGFKNED